MKKFKRLAAVMLALVMVFCISGIASAAGTDGGKGVITITNAQEGETYSVYKVFDLTYNTAGKGASGDKTYSYKLCEGWEEFFNKGDYAEYFTIDKNGYLNPGSDIFKQSDNSTVMAGFAKAALAYAKNKNITAAATKTAAKSTQTGTEGTTLVFSGLDLGYYLVNTSAGSLCILSSTDLAARVNEKNPTVSNKKYVRDNTDKDKEGDFLSSDNADIVDELEYEIILDTVEDLHNVCLHDRVSKELKLEEGTIEVYLNGDPKNALTPGTLKVAEETDADGHSVTVFDVTDGNYAIVYAGEDYFTDDDGCCFEIHFSDSFLDSLSDTDEIYITYKMTIDASEDAFINDYEEFDNVAEVSYGLARTSLPVMVSTYSYGFELYKYTKTGEEEMALAGAQFVLSYKPGSGDVEKYASFTKNSMGEYLLTGWDGSTEDPASIITSVAEGNVYIEGLDPDTTYYLTEIAAPDGYNMLEEPIEIHFGVDKSDASVFTVTYGGVEAGDHLVKVLNNQGSILPGTGGMGTTIFYVIGIVLVLGAVVILVTRRRMNNAR